MRVITAMLLLFVLFLGVVYGTFTATGNDRIDMNGKVVGLCEGGDSGDNLALTSIMVEGYQSGASTPQNISVNINENTTVFHKYGKNLVMASTNDIHPGQKIEVRFSGRMMYTYPPQVNSSAIIILYDLT